MITKPLLTYSRNTTKRMMVKDALSPARLTPSTIKIKKHRKLNLRKYNSPALVV
jgi:carbohydrate-binding DOMON domain-containing protein